MQIVLSDIFRCNLMKLLFVLRVISTYGDITFYFIFKTYDFILK